MTKPERTRDDADATEPEREAKKKRNSLGEELEVDTPLLRTIASLLVPHHGWFLLRFSVEGPYDQDASSSVTEANGARVEEMTKEEEEEEDLSSFTPKSPIRKPYIPDELSDPTVYPEIHAAFEDAQAKYIEKLCRRTALFTSKYRRKEARSCLFNHEHLHPIREAAKRAVLHAAKSVIRLSSSVEGEPLTNCCGLWIDWDRESKTGTILTTAHLIRSKHPVEDHWIGRDEYDIKANVTVHLRDGTTAEGHYLYHQEHYDLAFFKVRVDEQVQFPYFNGNVHCGQDVFRLGRDQSMDLRITHGRVEYWNPASVERYHYMYFLHEQDDYLCDDDGGPVIDLEGKVVGLINNHLSASFVPSSILEKCVGLWTKFGCIPRLHLGMRFDSMRLLDPINVEKMWRMHNIEDGLIVEEVSKDSHAEKRGICFGDIIECFNGKRISTTIELENMLLVRCKDHFDQGNKLNAKINVSIQVFHPEERLRRTINLNVEVSDHGEIITKGTYPITSTEETSATVQSSQNVAGKFKMSCCLLSWNLLVAVSPRVLQL
ncbi:hypothetical protein ACQ4PT_047764 [Festuca glaucescens]